MTQIQKLDFEQQHKNADVYKIISPTNVEYILSIGNNSVVIFNAEGETLGRWAKMDFIKLLEEH